MRSTTLEVDTELAGARKAALDEVFDSPGPDGDQDRQLPAAPRGRRRGRNPEARADGTAIAAIARDAAIQQGYRTHPDPRPDHRHRCRSRRRLGPRAGSSPTARDGNAIRPPAPNAVIARTTADDALAGFRRDERSLWIRPRMRGLVAALRRNFRIHYYRLTPTPITASQLSRPVEHCEGCPVLAGVRNLYLDDPAVSCPDLHCNFEDRSIGCVGGN